ncbi:MAG: HAMP domain-containing protein, partial [Actinobacteria bacterium]|nr:HAMP domain-containing protein [Actinomycetota bacterium]
ENLWYFSFSSMHDELAAIDTFYRNESRSVNLLLALVLGGSIIALIVMTFFVLSYLIRKKITRPIDELVTAAEQAMEGDVDVQVPVRPGEEFEGLKTAFNQMLARLREIIYQSIEGPGSTGGQPSSGTSPASTGVPVRRRGRSSMLIQVTALVVVIFIIAGGLSLFLFQKSQSRLIDRSTEKIIQSSAESITSGHYYISDLIVRYYALIVPTSTESDAMKDFLNALKTKQTSLLQEGMNLILEDLREKSLHGIELAFEALPPIPGIITVPTVFTSSDDKYMYVEVPEALVDLYEMSSDENTPLRARLNEENTYMLAEGGVPELGLEGPYLITTYKQKIDPSSQLEFWFFDFKPMQEQLADIDNFYTKENRNTIITMSIVIGVCIIVVALIIFFVLSHLLRTGITRPVDELAEAAEQVMGGNMDVVVPVRKGEEFEGLKNAFNAMVSSIRELMEKGVIE